jgi:deferrochelatase/peroxidase EfeB
MKVRQSMPFGKYNKNGLLFIAYSNDVSKFDKMLGNLIIFFNYFH